MGRDHASDSGGGWKKQQIKGKWHSIVAVFISVTLMFVIINGLARGFSFKNEFSKPKWDGKSSIPIAIGGENAGLFIFQPDLDNLVLFTISGDTFFETGDRDEPIAKISSVISGDGLEFSKALTKTYETKIDNVIVMRDKIKLETESAKKMFLSFASIGTPIKLLTAGWGDNVENTNITRIDAFRLWWQVKSLSVDDLVVADLSSLQEEIITYDNQKVLGADTESLSRKVSKYLENFTILEEGIGIRIENSADSKAALQLAASFIANAGGSIASVEASDSLRSQTQIVTDNGSSYTAQYLANLFDCDINEAKTGDKTSGITLILGTDFTSRYYE